MTLADQKFFFKILDLANLRRGNRYNPFAYIRDDKDVTKLASAIITGTKGLGKQADDEFAMAEATLYSALIGIIDSEAPEDERNMNTLVEGLRYMEPDKYEDGDKAKSAVDLLFDEKEADNPDSIFVRRYREYENMAGNTAKEIIKSCTERLAQFDNSEAYDFFSDDELSLNSLTIPKTALFVNSGTSDTALNFIASLMYAQLYNTLWNEASGDTKVNISNMPAVQHEISAKWRALLYQNQKN